MGADFSTFLAASVIGGCIVALTQPTARDQVSEYMRALARKRWRK